jgi:hypothetical protein
MSVVYKVWCEWDIGLEDVVFDDEDVAERYARAAIAEMMDDDFEDLVRESLIGLDIIEVISEKMQPKEKIIMPVGGPV